jgi:hypothetical protein
MIGRAEPVPPTPTPWNRIERWDAFMAAADKETREYMELLVEAIKTAYREDLGEDRKAYFGDASAKELIISAFEWHGHVATRGKLIK